MTSVLLSIRPEYARAILAGSKKVEFRRQAFKRAVRSVFLYSTGPGGGIVGMFAVATIRLMRPTTAWRRYRRVAGISRKAFFQYFEGARRAICIEITAVRRAVAPLRPKHRGPKFAAPQSFQYLSPPRSRRLEAAMASPARRVRDRPACVTAPS